MTHKAIEQVQHIDAQIAVLREILHKGDLVAAGLTVGINLGPLPEDRTFGCIAQIPYKTEEILQAMLGSLTLSRDFWVKQAKIEFNSLGHFLDKESGK